MNDFAHDVELFLKGSVIVVNEVTQIQRKIFHHQFFVIIFIIELLFLKEIGWNVAAAFNIFEECKKIEFIFKSIFSDFVLFIKSFHHKLTPFSKLFQIISIKDLWLLYRHVRYRMNWLKIKELKMTCSHRLRVLSFFIYWSFLLKLLKNPNTI